MAAVDSLARMLSSTKRSQTDGELAEDDERFVGIFLLGIDESMDTRHDC